MTGKGPADPSGAMRHHMWNSKLPGPPPGMQVPVAMPGGPMARHPVAAPMFPYHHSAGGGGAVALAAPPPARPHARPLDARPPPPRLRFPERQPQGGRAQEAEASTEPAVRPEMSQTEAGHAGGSRQGESGTVTTGDLRGITLTHTLVAEKQRMAFIVLKGTVHIDENGLGISEHMGGCGCGWQFSPYGIHRYD